jgi:hypothetical protein
MDNEKFILELIVFSFAIEVLVLSENGKNILINPGDAKFPPSFRFTYQKKDFEFFFFFFLVPWNLKQLRQK